MHASVSQRPSHHRRRRRLIVAVAVAAALLLVLRAVAPLVVERYLNQTLSDMGDYRGRVQDVDLSLWQGGYAVDGLVIRKADTAIEQPLLRAPRIEASVQWNALLQGALVGEMVFVEPVVNFVQQGEERQYGEGIDWRARLLSLFPVRLNRLTVRDGSVHFRNPGADPPVDVYLSDVQTNVANLTNIRRSDAPVFTGLEASATAMGHAPVAITGRLDPWQDDPRFDLDFQLRELDLTRLNGFLESYLNVTAEAGTFSLYTEIAAADGTYEGYVKPLLDDIEILDTEDFEDRPLGAIWESVVAAAAQLFENPSKDRLGTRVPVSGELNPDLDLMAAVAGVFRNLFDAFLRGVEGTVDLQDAIEEARKQGDGDDDQ